MDLSVICAARRQQLLENIGEGVVLLPSAPTYIRNNDVEHEYRQESDFYYLTGFDEPESVAIMTRHHPEHRFVLFVRPRDPEREVWDGARAGIEGAKEHFGADAAFPISELRARLPEYLTNVTRVHHRFGRDARFDSILMETLEKIRARSRRGDFAPSELFDFAPSIHEMRLRKDDYEIATMRKAAAITAEAHTKAMHVAKPGAFEYEVEAALLETFRGRGAERPAYGSIVGSGPNATVLHYRSNNRKMEDGDLLLIDAGAEFGYYACDVTRTFPVNGRFSNEQAVIYQIVLDAQKAAIAAVKPGASFNDPHDAALNVIAQGLLEARIITAPSLKEAVEKELYKPYFMHRTSHWLGMDVHDVGAYYLNKNPRALLPGFVLTIEPGIYIAKGASVEPRYQGIGVRIEDDVLVTETGHDVLTAEIPKEINELTAILGGRG